LYEDETGIEHLGQMIEGTYNSLNFHYYGSLYHFYRMMLGHMMDPFHKVGVSTKHKRTIYEHTLKLCITCLVVGGKKVIREDNLYIRIRTASHTSTLQIIKHCPKRFGLETILSIHTQIDKRTLKLTASLLVPHVTDNLDSLGHSAYNTITISDFTYSFPCITV
jgi:hypothetical protein